MMSLLIETSKGTETIDVNAYPSIQIDILMVPHNRYGERWSIGSRVEETTRRDLKTKRLLSKF